MNHSLYLGVIMLVGLLGGKIASKLKLPSVTGYILFGLLLGPSITNIITIEMIKSFQFVNHLALGILGLSIGAELHQLVFKKFGKDLFIVALGDNLIIFSLVAIITYLLGLSLQFAIILGILAMTVSPSAVLSIVKEYRAKGKFTQNLLALVAIENLHCIVLFGIVTAVLQGLGQSSLTGLGLVTVLLKEIGLSLVLGCITGGLISYMIKWRPHNNKFLVFLLGSILLNIGLATQFNLSALLVNMTTGAVITNLTNRKFILSSTLERIELPIFVIFLTLAGAKLDLTILANVGYIGLGYIGARLIGRLAGSYIASGFTSLEQPIRNNIGMALTPQAGVAIGLSIIAEQKFPQANGVIAGIVLSGVIFFEILGPLLLKKALSNTGDIEQPVTIPPNAKEMQV